MDSIDKQCKIAKNLDSNSTAVFEMHIVILLGDFRQLPPIQAKALWQKQDGNEEKRGQQLWHMFKDVVCPDEQMRQRDDIRYYKLLKRARSGSLIQDDIDLLDTRVVTELDMQIRTNKLRLLINRLQIERFARRYVQTKDFYISG
jgi:hypothetical protein